MNFLQAYHRAKCLTVVGRASVAPSNFRACPIALVVFSCCAAFASEPKEVESAGKAEVFYAAPRQAGDGSGCTSTSPANFRDPQFWSTVRQALQNEAVIVNFLDGKYLVSADEQQRMPTLVLSDMGSQDHRLILQGTSKDGVLFTRLENDVANNEREPGFLHVKRSQNMVIRNFHFTGDQAIGYATHFSGRNFVIENCSWIDLPGVHFGATGTDGKSDHVTFKNCVFKRVGSGRHSHMAYNAYGPQHVAFINCWFEDCSGDYIRYRDSADFGVVVGCTFKSTGTYLNGNMPFISVPLYNDDNPEKPTGTPNYEYFGTHFLIFNNRFVYPNDNPDGERVAMLFHHSGHNPPGCNFLLTPQQAKLLAEGEEQKKKSFIRKNFLIDPDRIHFFSNSFTAVAFQVAYRSNAAYGAKSNGWKGIIDIADAINGKKVLQNESEALTFFGQSSLPAIK